MRTWSIGGSAWSWLVWDGFDLENSALFLSLSSFGKLSQAPSPGGGQDLRVRMKESILTECQNSLNESENAQNWHITFASFSWLKSIPRATQNHWVGGCVGRSLDRRSSKVTLKRKGQGSWTIFIICSTVRLVYIIFWCFWNFCTSFFASLPSWVIFTMSSKQNLHKKCKMWEINSYTGWIVLFGVHLMQTVILSINNTRGSFCSQSSYNTNRSAK